jgi:hypothetical protein
MILFINQGKKPENASFRLFTVRVLITVTRSPQNVAVSPDLTSAAPQNCLVSPNLVFVSPMIVLVSPVAVPKALKIASTTGYITTKKREAENKKVLFVPF